MSRRAARIALVLVALLVTGALTGIASSTAGPGSLATPPEGSARTTPARGDGDLYAAVRPEMRGEIVRETEGTLPRYTIDATLIPPGGTLPATDPSSATPAALPDLALQPSDEARVVGVEELSFVNTTGDPLRELQLRLYPNLRQYDTGRMVISNVAVNGETARLEAPPLISVPSSTPVATPTPDQADLILVRVPLRTPLAPGQTALVSMDFITTIPTAPPDDTGLFRYHPETDQWTIAHWFPILAGYDPESGWESDPPAAWSDITFSNTALYDVTLTAPEDLVLVTPGVETSRQHRGSYLAHRYVTGPARDMPIVAQKNLDVTATVVDGVIVTSYAPADSMDGAKQMLTWAADALSTYAELFGPYPYATLDIVAVPDMTGYEFPEMIMLGADFYADPVNAGSRPGAIEFLVAHEVAHQWWYGLVGSNPHRHAFLDEGLAEYSAVVYFERQHGRAEAETQRYAGLTVRYASMLVSSGDRIVDEPTSAFPDDLTYYATAYRKAGLGFAAIRDEIGDDAFFAALEAYAGKMRFGVATPRDLLDAFEDASGENLDALWQLWFEDTRGRVAIVMEPEPVTPAASPMATPAASPVATPTGATPVD